MRVKIMKIVLRRPARGGGFPRAAGHGRFRLHRLVVGLIMVSLLACNTTNTSIPPQASARATSNTAAPPATLTSATVGTADIPQASPVAEAQLAPDNPTTAGNATQTVQLSPTPPPTEANPQVVMPVITQDVLAGPDNAWPMAAGNPQRTSWTPEEVRGDLEPVWFTRFQGYISQKVQIIAAYGRLYIAHSQGLTAISAVTGEEIWNYPTSLPLGHSPTVQDGIVYAPGLDKKIHALEARNGRFLWSFEAAAGFQTNPLIAENLLLAGNRDGTFYAIHITGDRVGQAAWTFPTRGPILFSAAYADGLVYFASQDGHAYALRAQDGSQVWKVKLSGYGFHSWWPVIYRDQVVFSGSWNYRYPDPASQQHIGESAPEILETYPQGAKDGTPLGPVGQEPGDWVSGQETVNAQGAAQYFEKYPHRRTVFVLSRQTGAELTYDSDGDGQPEYAPFLWFGTHAGTRYPAAVGPDSVLYQSAPLYYRKMIPRGRIVGWKIGTPMISVPRGSDTAVDEPVAYAIGGNTVYWKRCCDRMAGAFEIARAGAKASDLQSWVYYDEGGNILRRRIPELFAGGWDFAYWKHGDQSPPIPYHGRVYTIVNNAVVAFAPNGEGYKFSNEQKSGKPLGEKAQDIEREHTARGLITALTAADGQWPALIRQTSYYSTSDQPGARARWQALLEVAAAGSPSAHSVEQQGLYDLLRSGPLQAWASHLAPTNLFLNTSNIYHLNANFSGMVYPTAQGIQQITSGKIDGRDLSAGWLLVWNQSPDQRWTPLVISLEHRPLQIQFSPAGIDLTFDGPAGYLAITPLYGLASPYPPEQVQWKPEDFQRVETLDRLARAFPMQFETSSTIDPASGDALLSYRYTFQEWPGDWQTAPLRLAALPPELALAAWAPDAAHASPIRINDKPFSQQFDLGWLTPLGRVGGVADASEVQVRLPGLAKIWRASARQTAPNAPAADDLQYQQLLREVQKMLDAGHLRPAYGMVGIWEAKGIHRFGDHLVDYWHNPAETVITLLAALPYLPAEMQAQVKAYVQTEAIAYPLHKTAHVGWRDGAGRGFFDLPPDVEQAAAEMGPRGRTEFNNWGLPPTNLYAMARYAEVFGNAKELFPLAKEQLDLTPQFETSTPYVLNSYIAGYSGYLQLAEMAGAGPQPEAETGMIRLLVLRAALSKYPRALEQTGFEYGGYAWTVRQFFPYATDTLFDVTITGNLWSQIPLYGYPQDWLTGLSGPGLGGGYAFSIDFVNLTPENAAFLRQYTPLEAIEIWEAYTRRAPYWFLAEAEETGGESVYQPLHNRAAFFQARALVLQKPRSELEPYLDVPWAAVGDLYYIQNLIYTLAAQ